MNEDELRELLRGYGYGLELIEFTKRDRINVYPTRREHIHKIQLDLRLHLKDCNPEEILKYLLTKAEFDDYSGKTQQLTLVPKQGVKE